MICYYYNDINTYVKIKKWKKILFIQHYQQVNRQWQSWHTWTQEEEKLVICVSQTYVILLKKLIKKITFWIKTQNPIPILKSNVLILSFFTELHAEFFSEKNPLKSDTLFLCSLSLYKLFRHLTKYITSKSRVGPTDTQNNSFLCLFCSFFSVWNQGHVEVCDSTLLISVLPCLSTATV